MTRWTATSRPGVVLHVQEEVYQSTLTFRRTEGEELGTKNDALDPSGPKFLFLILTHPSSILN